MRDAFHRFRNRFGQKNIKITTETVSAGEEAAATFLEELKKSIRVPYYAVSDNHWGSWNIFPKDKGRLTVGKKKGLFTSMCENVHESKISQGSFSWLLAVISESSPSARQKI